MAHVDEDTLFRFTLGELDGARTAAVQSHLDSCGDCRKAQESLSSIAFSRTVAPTPSGDGVNTRPDSPDAAARQKGPSFEKGVEVGRYVLLDKLGAGGMGEVFSAYDPQLDRKVAIKLLRAGSLSAEEGKARLLREAQSLARLQHPNVIAVHDVGTVGDRVFIAMEFVSGETLGDWLRVPRTWRKTLSVYLDAGRGLAAAHKAGLIHRDFKPDNVLIGEDDERPRVLDFGLARQALATPAPRVPLPAEVPEGDSSLSARLTRDGAVMGTPGYMAPEQLAGLDTDARSDQFAFCVSLFEGLYGTRPFGGATLRQHAQEISQGRVLTPPAGTNVPPRLYEVLKRGLSANPADRFTDVSALLVALEQATRRRRRLALTTIALGLIAVAGAGAFAWSQQRLRVCGGAEKRLSGVWDSTVKHALERQFQSTGLSFGAGAFKSVAKSFDAYALEWVHASRDTCEAARLRQVDSEALYQLKSACLEQRLERLRALSNVLHTADKDIVANAPTAARSLDPVATCLDARGLKPDTITDAQQRASEVALRGAVAQARALFDSGKYARGAELLRASIKADASARSQAEASLWLGRLETRSGDPKAARRANLLAAEKALEAADAALQAIAFSRLYANEGFDAAEADAEDWGRLAHAARARVPSDWEVQVELALNDGLIALKRKKLQEALAEFEQALRLYEEHLGPDHPDVARVLNNLGVTLSHLGDLDGALTKYERALAIHQAVGGVDHPSVATADSNIGFALRRQGRYAEALTHYENALRIQRATVGPRHPDTARTAVALSKVLIVVGRHEAALGLLNGELESQLAQHGPSSAEVGQLYELMSELYQAGQHWKEAQRYAELELTVFIEAKGPESAEVARAWYTLGVVQTRQGRWQEAKRALDTALKLRVAKVGAESSEVASLWNALGDLFLAQGQLDEALAAFTRARTLRVSNAQATKESVAADLLGIGRCHLARLSPKDAVDPLEEALTLLQATESPGARVAVYVALAQALAQSGGGDPARPQALVAQARAEAGDDVAALRDIDTAAARLHSADAGR